MPKTKIKFCGITRIEEILTINRLQPEYIGFVFYPKSKRYVTAETAKQLKQQLAPAIKAVGVFVDEAPEVIGELLSQGIIDMAQLHGKEEEAYLSRLRQLTEKPLIKAFKVNSCEDVLRAQECSADYVLLDAGMGDGVTFDWSLIKEIRRPYFLAGGLTCQNVGAAIRELKPYAVDVSSGIEADEIVLTSKAEINLTRKAEINLTHKVDYKMQQFIHIVRG